MKQLFSTILLLLALCATQAQERIEPVPFGDFEQWTVRYIKESGILGGNTKIQYFPAPTDTLRGNRPFPYGRGGSWWSTSNAYARVAGIDKASGTVVPEKRGDGWCCRMDSRIDGITVLGIIDLKVFVAGTIFTGATNEPVTQKGANDPYSVLCVGVPFTGHPTALMLDYKAIIENSNEIYYAQATSHPKKREGHDEAEMYVLLQQRWEDADGNIHARRVGTAYERITESVYYWKNDHRIPIYWGDIRKQPFYQDYMGLNDKPFRARNSKGQVVTVVEEGYSINEPTHIIIVITSGKYQAFIGHPGNTVWVDNIRLVYNDAK